MSDRVRVHLKCYWGHTYYDHTASECPERQYDPNSYTGGEYLHGCQKPTHCLTCHVPLT